MRSLSVMKKGLLITGTALLLCSVGCSSTQVDSTKTFRIATRQLPPEPVYNPIRWVRPPQVLPARDATLHKAPAVLPVVRFEAENTPLREAALMLAATARYKSYCASMIAERSITLESLGTIEELAREIAQVAGVTVIVDHGNKEIRFLASNEVLKYEYQSSHS